MVTLVRVQGLADDGLHDARPNVPNKDHVGDRHEDGHHHEDGSSYDRAGFSEGGLPHLRFAVNTQGTGGVDTIFCLTNRKDKPRANAKNVDNAEHQTKRRSSWP